MKLSNFVMRIFSSWGMDGAPSVRRPWRFLSVEERGQDEWKEPQSTLPLGLRYEV